MAGLNELLTPAEAAALLRVTTDTLEAWRAKRAGPAWVKLGDGIRAPVRYALADVNAYLQSKTEGTNVNKRGPNPGPGLPEPTDEQLAAACERALKTGKYSRDAVHTVVAELMGVTPERVAEAVRGESVGGRSVGGQE